MIWDETDAGAILLPLGTLPELLAPAVLGFVQTETGAGAVEGRRDGSAAPVRGGCCGCFLAKAREIKSDMETGCLAT